MIFICLAPQYKIVISRDVAASRQLAPEVIMVRIVSPLDEPRRGVGPLEVRFAHPVRLSPATHSQGEGTEKVPPW